MTIDNHRHSYAQMPRPIESYFLQPAQTIESRVGGLMIYRGLLLIFVSFIFSQPLRSSEPETAMPRDPEKIQKHNEDVFRSRKKPDQEHRTYLTPPRWKPFPEYQKVKTLIFSDGTNFGSKEIKKEIAKHLPDGVSLTVITSSDESEKEIRRTYEEYLPRARISILTSKTAQNIWARDYIPIPLIGDIPTEKSLYLVDSQYYHGDEPDYDVAHEFNASLLKNPYYYEGGNFLSDSKGRCIVIQNNRISPDFGDILRNIYGCRSVFFLPHLNGIGHIDERVKFISDTIAVTDTPQYAAQLETLGFQIFILPRPEGGEYRTYVNSLQINGSLFLPIFGTKQDDDAQKIYEATGLEVYPILAQELSDVGAGNIHCITMTYPDLE